MLRLQRPVKTSRTSLKPPATDHKERREQAKPGGAKPGHEGHSRVMSDDPDAVIDHRPDRCSCCGGALHGDLPAEVVSVSERIELPAVMPVVTQHRRLAAHCPTCGARVVAPVPEAAHGTPFGPRLHAMATYLKTFQALSYKRLQAALSDLFGLRPPGAQRHSLASAHGRALGGHSGALRASHHLRQPVPALAQARHLGPASGCRVAGVRGRSADDRRHQRARPPTCGHL